VKVENQSRGKSTKADKAQIKPFFIKALDLILDVFSFVINGAYLDFVRIDTFA